MGERWWETQSPSGLPPLPKKKNKVAYVISTECRRRAQTASSTKVARARSDGAATASTRWTVEKASGHRNGLVSVVWEK